MKQKLHFSAIFFLMVFLLTSSHLTARILPMKHGDGEGEKLIDVIGDEDSLPNNEHTDSLNELLGLDECENGDSECFNRRFLAEAAHLDYIYTQSRKAP